MTGASRTARLGKRIDEALRAGHPWVWRNALKDPPGSAGEVVTVTDDRGEFVARGIADSGPIGVRVWVTEDVSVDGALLSARFEAAAALRDRVVPAETNAYRLLHGEGDRAPGIVCDVYGSHAVLRLDGGGLVPWRGRIVDALRPVLAARGVEHLHEKRGARGAHVVETLYGTRPTAPVPVVERGMKLHADLLEGQKTGLFLDQRETRRRVRELARGARVLNLYGYTGGFSVAALLGGATVAVTVDVAPEAVRAADANCAANGLPQERHQGIAEDVPHFLSETIRRAEQYDVVIADPPNFAPSEDAVDRALESYVRLHEASLRVVARSGLYLACSCSSHVTMAAFEGTVREGARRFGVQLQVLERASAPADHPRLLSFPESDYLKTLLCRVLP